MKKEQELSETMFADVIGEKNLIAKTVGQAGIRLSQNIPKWYRFAAANQPYGTVFIVEQKKEEKSGSIDAKKASAFIKYERLWKQETAALSSPSAIRMNRNYQKIIGLGDAVVPLILCELEREPDDWFYALEMLVDDKENPVNDEMGFNESVEAWLKWGRDNGLI